ncbi:MAG: choice-of-anchor B family protein [Phycisphaerales bacterium JB040]
MRARTTAGLIGVAGLVAAAGLVIAHDEDWRKLADRVPAVEGDVYRLGDRVTRDDTFDSLNMVCYSWFPLNTFGLGSSNGTDIWGYTSPSGREYAIMCLGNGYGFVEVTDPVNAQIVEVISSVQSSWHDVKVIGEYAYGVSEGGLGIQVMDMSDIDNGNVSLIASVQDAGHSTSHNIVANEQAGTLWVVGGNLGNGGLIHHDLSNPANPQVDGGWTEMYVHDAQVVTINPGDPQAAQYQGREIAFCASGFGNGSTNTGLRIVDVTNPNSPQVLSTLFYSTPGYSHQVWLSEDRQYLYLNDELDEANGFVSETTTRIIDVSDLTNPFQVTTSSTGLPSIDHNLYIKDGLMYQSNYRSGLRVFDVSGDPMNPVEIAWFDSFPGSDSAAFNGNWSNYPFFDSGTIVISDIERGLFVLGLDLENLALSPIDTPDVLNPAGGETAQIDIVANSTSVDGGTVQMRVQQGAGVEFVSGTNVGGDTWEFVFPAVDCGENVSYSFSADSTGGESFLLPADGSSYSALVSTGTAVTFQDNAESDLGWTVSGVTAQLSGGWTRNVPQGFDRGDPATDSDGSGNAFLTGWDAGTNNTDVDSGTTILTSPILDLSSPGFVSYDYWINDVANGALTPEDGLFVEVSTNGGSSWTRVRTYATALDAWIADTIDIESEIGLTANGRIRFLAADEGGQNVVEAGMDNFAVVASECVPPVDCPADVTGDGVLDNGDIGAFVTLFLAGDMAADFTGDGVLDNGDIGAFVVEFLAGCE